MDLTPEDRITDEAVRAAAEAIEDEAIRRIGRDLGTIHRDDIVRAGLTAALPLLGTAWLGDRVECADCGRTSGYCKCGDIDAAEMARLMHERVLRESAQDEVTAQAHVTVNADDLGIVLDQRVQHSHMCPGIWDDSNRPAIAGRPCVECAARGRLHAALNVADQVNQPRTPSGCDGEDSPEERTDG